MSNKTPRECNIASHLYVPQYKNLWALAKDKGYIGFAYDVDNCNQGIVVDKDSMDAVYTESVYELFKEHDKNRRLDPQLKQQLLTYALAQTLDFSEKAEKYWAAKSKKHNLPNLADTTQTCGLGMYEFTSKNKHVTDPGFGFTHNSENNGEVTDKLAKEQADLFERAREEFYGSQDTHM